jgi:Mg/Co/Ni transporter MgtE
VKGTAAANELGEITHHWLTVTGFERGQDGSMSLAEESGAIKPCDVIAGVNRTSFLDKTFNECLKSIAMAEWPLTLHLLRDPEKEPSLIEGWCVAVREDNRPLCSAKDEVRLKWQNQKPGPDTYRAYLELRPGTGELLLSRPVSGGGMEQRPERCWHLRDVGVVRRVCEKPPSGVGAKWCVDLSLHVNGGPMKTNLRIQLAGAAEMHVWGETLEAAARLPALQRATPQSLAGKHGGGLLAGVTMVTEGQGDDDEETMDLPALLLQPKSATSLPLDLSGLPKSGGFTFEVEDAGQLAGSADQSPSSSLVDSGRAQLADGDEDAGEASLDDKAARSMQGGSYAASPSLAAKLTGLASITRAPEDANAAEAAAASYLEALKSGSAKGKTARDFGAPMWVTQSVTFEKKAPLHLVVKGVAKTGQQPKVKGHFIVVAGFTAKDEAGRAGPAEESGRIRIGDAIVGLNGEPLPENTTFNDFAKAVRECAWPLTLHLVRDSDKVDPPDHEGWVARLSLNPTQPEALLLNGAMDTSSSFVGGKAEGSSRRYLSLRGRWLQYHKPVPGGALAAKPEGAWDISTVELLQAVFDKHGPPGEQWGVALKLREPVAVAPGSQAMMGHALICCATQADAQAWCQKLAHWALADRARADANKDRRRGGLKRGEAQPLVVAPTIWASGLDSADKMPAGSRVSALRSRIDRMFFEEYDALLALVNAGPPEPYQPPALPGQEGRVSGAGAGQARLSIVSGGALFRQKGLHKRGEGYAGEGDLGEDGALAAAQMSMTSNPAAGKSIAVAEARAWAGRQVDQEAAKRLLASSLFATTRLGESPTLGQALYDFQSGAGGTLSAPDTRLLLSACGVTAYGSKTVKDETGLVEKLQDTIRNSENGGVLPVHDVASWILAYAKARAELFLALSKAKRRKALRSDMSRAERHLVTFALPTEDVAEVLTMVQPEDQRDLLRRRTAAEIAAIVVELPGGEPTRASVLSLVDPDMATLVASELNGALAAQLQDRLKEGKPSLAIVALKRMSAADGTRALDHLSSDECAACLDELPTDKERNATLSRMDVHAALAARRALDRRYLRKVLGSGGGKPTPARVAALFSLTPDHGAAALAALAREDHHVNAAAAAAAAATGRDPLLAGAPSGAAAAAELLVSLDDWKLRTSLLRKLPPSSAGDILATMQPVDAAACLNKLAKVETQAAVLAAMHPHEAAAVVDVMPPDQQGVVAPAYKRAAAGVDALWRLSPPEQAAQLHGMSSSSSAAAVAASGVFNDDGGRHAFLQRLTSEDRADLLMSLSATSERAVLLNAMPPLERRDTCAALGSRHAPALAALPPPDRLDVVVKLPGGALAPTLAGLDQSAASDVFSRMGAEQRGKVMARLMKEATPDDAAAVLRLLAPEVAASCIKLLPAQGRACMLLPLARSERDAILAHLSTGALAGSTAEGQLAQQLRQEAAGLGQQSDTRVIELEATARRLAANEREATLRAIAAAKAQASQWETMKPHDVAELVCGGSLPPLAVGTTLSLMDARDVCNVLDAIDAQAGSEVQARVLAMLPVVFRRTMVAQLGSLLCERLSRGAVGASSSGAKVPSASALARSMLARPPIVAAAVLASLQLEAAWTVLQAMRPQAQAAAVACLLPAQKAELCAALEPKHAAGLVASLAPRDQAATLLNMPPAAQETIMATFTSDTLRLAHTAIQTHGSSVASSSGMSEAEAATAETLKIMGPAQQALVLSTLPAQAAAALLGPLTSERRAGALVGVNLEQRQRILGSMSAPAAADTIVALKVLEPSSSEASAGAREDRSSSRSRNLMSGMASGMSGMAASFGLKRSNSGRDLGPASSDAAPAQAAAPVVPVSSVPEDEDDSSSDEEADV